MTASLRFLSSRYSVTSRNFEKCIRRWLSESSGTVSDQTSQKTALYDFHIKNKGKMVDFGGYQLPVQYGDMSIIASHLHTRKSASMFDVSHMLQTYIRGKDCIECFETLCPADVKGMKPNSCTLTIFTTEKGTIYDDLIVTKVSNDCLYVVSNAAMRKQDVGIMDSTVRKFQSMGKDVSVEFLPHTEQSLVAIQGPSAVRLLEKLVQNCDLKYLYFMTTAEAEIAGVPGCRITRCGYTGEDGVEISVPSDRVSHIAEAILDITDMKLAGLGARNSLRLEAGLCLYATDIDQTTTPVEAGLSWLIAKRRRAEENYPGAKILNEQLKRGVARRRVGFSMTSGPAARHGVQIYINGSHVGRVTSGCPSPSLGGNIGMGYIRDEFKKPNTEIQLKIRGNLYAGTVAKMPFVKTGYYITH